MKRVETYAYFLLIFMLSLVAIDFVFEGQLDPLNANAPYTISFSMSVLSAFLLIINSMVMGSRRLEGLRVQNAVLDFHQSHNKSGISVREIPGITDCFIWDLPHDDRRFLVQPIFAMEGGK